MLNRPFAHSVTHKGADALIEAHEQQLAMSVLMSGMFDERLKELKKERKEVAKHKYAINTVEEVDAMKAQVVETLENVRQAESLAQKTLEDADVKAKEVVEQAQADAQAAVDERAVTLANTKAEADAILQEARTEANGIRASIKNDHKALLAKIEAAKAELEKREADNVNAQAELQATRQMIVDEKARIRQLFGDTAS